MAESFAPMKVLKCPNTDLRVKAIKVYADRHSTKEQKADVYREVTKESKRIATEARELAAERILRKWEMFMGSCFKYGEKHE